MTDTKPVRLVKKYTLGWLLWLACFCWLEGAALLRKADGDTLTEHIREWLHLRSKKVWAGWAAMAAFLGWLVYHFLFA